MAFRSVAGIKPTWARLPGALMEASEHQQLPLAEDHPVPAAAGRTTRCPERRTKSLTLYLLTQTITNYFQLVHLFVPT